MFPLSSIFTYLCSLLDYLATMVPMLLQDPSRHIPLKLKKERNVGRIMIRQA